MRFEEIGLEVEAAWAAIFSALLRSASLTAFVFFLFESSYWFLSPYEALDPGTLLKLVIPVPNGVVTKCFVDRAWFL